MTGHRPDWSPGCSFWIWWVLTNALSLGVGWAAGWGLSYLLPGELAPVILGATAGMATGLAQWLLIRNGAGIGIRWILATAFGWILGFALGAEVGLYFALTGFLFGATGGLLVGFFVGIFQWLVLRKSFTGSGWWILANIFVWPHALFLYRPGISAMGVFYGGVAGAVTGLVLVFGLRRAGRDIQP